MQSTVVFRRAQEEDAAVIAKLRQEIWSTTYRGIYPDDMIDQFDYAWHTQKDAQRIKSPAYAVYLMMQEDHPIGYITLHISVPAHLLSLYLRQEYQHRGIGRRVFSFIQEVFQTRGVSTFTCECQPDNVHAMTFYRRCGGRVVGEDLSNEESWQNSVTFQFYVMRETDLVIRIIQSMDECIEFVRGFHGDAQFSDPMLTNEEQFQTNLVKCVEHPDRHCALGVYLGEQLIGLFTFLVLLEERYLEMLVGLSRDRRAYAEMFRYLERHYPGYSADFVFNPRNHLFCYQLGYLRKGMLSLGQMRADGELTREQYQNLYAQTAAEREKLQGQLEHASVEGGGAPKLDLTQIKKKLAQVVDVSTPKISDELVEEFVEVVTPVEDYHYRWKLNFGAIQERGRYDFLHPESPPVLSFTIDFEMARQYRKENELPPQFRRSSWNDLFVEVYL